MAVSDFFREFRSSPTGDTLAAWQQWFTAQGIDPNDVAWDAWVERRDNPGQKQIVYMSDANDVDGSAIKVERTVDLSQSPLPFPSI